MQPFLQTRLERSARRLGELDFLLSREDIMADMAQYRVLSREHADVTQVAGRYARWQQCQADLAGARELLQDPDMADMAQEEVTAAEAELAQLEANCSACCCPRTPRMRATPFWKSAPAPAATSRRCLPASWRACTCATPTAWAGRWRW